MTPPPPRPRRESYAFVESTNLDSEYLPSEATNVSQGKEGGKTIEEYFDSKRQQKLQKLVTASVGARPLLCMVVVGHGSHDGVLRLSAAQRRS